VSLYSKPGEEAHPSWLVRNGPQQLQLLFRAIGFRPTTRLLLIDDERNCHSASLGAARMIGVAPTAIAAQKLDTFVEADFLPELNRLWRGFLIENQEEGRLALATADGSATEIAYTARKLVLPGLHLLALRAPETTGMPVPSLNESTGREMTECALLLLDSEGHVVGWYSGAVRLYGYTASEITGRPLSNFHADAGEQQELHRASTEGHAGAEGWHTRKDGSKFWANAITLALRNEQGRLEGFARVVRDFTDRHDKAEASQSGYSRQSSAPARAMVAGVASGEFDHEPEMNDALLDLLGLSRSDVASGSVSWADLTPDGSASADDVALEEALRFGASTPYEKAFIRKDGSLVRTMVTTAVLKLCPLRWITFVQDLQQEEFKDAVEQPESEASPAFAEIVGASAALKRLLRQVEVVSPTDATVLILGETGTGKELIARAIHRISPRRNLPFISLNCAAIPTGLLESELFGYERGAFTGALSQKIGRFEMAHRGTLFLDEIGDIPLELQPKLLRALQEQSFERLGGTKTIPIDVRLVAATNRNLSQMMEDKLFRSDLYYRLKVFPLTAPPLRDRPDDIPVLVRHFTRSTRPRWAGTSIRFPLTPCAS
jgi:PAS domain S-box-containing protein